MGRARQVAAWGERPALVCTWLALLAGLAWPGCSGEADAQSVGNSGSSDAAPDAAGDAVEDRKDAFDGWGWFSGCYSTPNRFTLAGDGYFGTAPAFEPYVFGDFCYATASIEGFPEAHYQVQGWNDRLELTPSMSSSEPLTGGDASATEHHFTTWNKITLPLTNGEPSGGAFAEVFNEWQDDSGEGAEGATLELTVVELASR